MLKHIKPKDILEFFLFALAFIAIIAVAGFLESAPISIALWVAAGLGVILWITWFIVVAVQRKREAKRPTLKIMHNGKWVDVDSQVGAQLMAQHYASPRRPLEVFDQADYENKEKA